MQVGKIPRINLEGQYIYVSLCLGGIVVVVSDFASIKIYYSQSHNWSSIE